METPEASGTPESATLTPEELEVRPAGPVLHRQLALRLVPEPVVPDVESAVGRVE